VCFFFFWWVGGVFGVVLLAFALLEACCWFRCGFFFSRWGILSYDIFYAPVRFDGLLSSIECFFSFFRIEITLET